MSLHSALAILLTLALAASTASAGTTVIHVEIEGVGEIRAAEPGDIGPVAGRASNPNGSAVWTGKIWVINSTYAHQYFVDGGTGLRLKEYTTYTVDPSPVTLGAQPAFGNYAISKRRYAYAVPAAGSGAGGIFETYFYDAVETDLHDMTTGKDVVLRSRGLGLGVGTAFFDVFLDDESVGTPQATAILGDPVMRTFVDLTAAAAAELPGSTGVLTAFLLQSPKPLAPPGGELYFDIGGGADLGPAGVGKSYFFKLTPMAAPPVATIEPAGAFVTEFRLKYMDSSGNLQQIVVTPSLAAERKLSVRRSYLLPTKVAATPAKSTLTAVGVIDTGPAAPDFSGAATLHVGATSLAIPTWAVKGTRRSYKDSGLDLTIALAKAGTSKGKFKLKVTGAAAAGIDPAAPLDLWLESPAIDSVCRMALQSGKFALGKQPGALTLPGLYVLAAGAKLPGGGKDALALKLGFAPPVLFPASGDLEIRFRSQVVATVALDQLTVQGNVRSYRDANRTLAIDLAKETIALKVKGLDLGAPPQGAQPVLVSVQLAGEPAQAVEVRMERKGKALKY